MKRFQFFSILVVVSLVLGSWLVMPAPVLIAEEPGAGQPESLPQVQLLKSDADGITLAVRVPDVTLGKEEAGGRSWDALSIPGFVSTDEAGSPQVPVKRLLLGIPLGADYQIDISLGDSVPLPGQYDLIPAPRPLPQGTTDPTLIAQPAFVPSLESGQWEYAADPARYAVDSFYPSSVATIEESGFIRNQRFVAVQVNPVQYNPASGTALLHRQIAVEISFTYPRGQTLGNRQHAGAFEQVLASAIYNYESARDWRGKETGSIEAVQPTVLDGPAYKIQVEEEGIYEVTRAELEGAGVPVDTIDPATFKVHYHGGEVPIRAFESAGILESLWFYGEKLNTKFTETNVYWLTYDGLPGLRMGSKSVPPVSPGTAAVSANYTTTLRLEEDHYYRPQVPWDAQSDHWIWDYTYYPTTKPTASFNTDVSHVVTGTYTSTLTAIMIGFTDLPEDPDHCVDLYINGNYVTGHLWDGAGIQQNVEASFSPSLLVQGANQVRAEGCVTAAVRDIIWYDWLEMEVRREYFAEDDFLAFDVPEPNEQYELYGFSNDAIEIFDVSDVYSPTYLVDFTATLSDTEYVAAFHDAAAAPGMRYLAVTQDHLMSPAGIVEDLPSNLADPSNQADYIMIAPREYFADVQTLVDYRQAQGLAVVLVDLEDIFDEFNYGIYDPQAIQDFVAYAHGYWTAPEPTYLLLVGDGTYDYKNNLGISDPMKIPPYLAFVDPWIGETAADNRYVTVAGGDIFPDLIVARLPVAYISQLQNMIAKTIATETAPSTDGWNGHVLFATDNPDDAGDFYAFSDDLVNNYLPAPYVPHKVYTNQTCSPGSTCRAEIISSFNTTSTLLINYIGHAGNQQWASEEILRTADLGSLVPTDRWPIVLAMTCLEGYFHEPGYPSLAEAYVRQDSKGSVASWSPAGLGVAHGHDYLNKGFYEAVFFDGVRELGQAAYQGKADLYQVGLGLDQIDTYHLFGDPALYINALDADAEVTQSVEPAGPIAPGGMLTYTVPFANAGPATAHHVVLTAIIPSEMVSPTVVFSTSEVLTEHVGNSFVWTITNLLPYAGGEVQIAGTVSTDTMASTIVAGAEISISEPELDPSNNVASVTTDLLLSDLYVTTTGPGVASPGELLTYTISWGNLGGSRAFSLRMTDTLPSGVDYVGDSSGWSHTEPSPGVIVWEAETQQMPQGESNAFALTTRVQASLKPTGTLVNLVGVDSDAVDGNPSNNEDTWPTDLVPDGQNSFVYLPVVLRNLP